MLVSMLIVWHSEYGVTIPTTSLPPARTSRLIQRRSAIQVEIPDLFYPFGLYYHDNEMFLSDDSCEYIPTNDAFPFFGSNYKELYVSQL